MSKRESEKRIKMRFLTNWLHKTGNIIKTNIININIIMTLYTRQFLIFGSKK